VENLHQSSETRLGMPYSYLQYNCSSGDSFMIWLINLLSKSYGHSEGFTIGILFLPFIFLPILGLGDSKYVGPAGKPKEAQA
jgi:hypothetical protein